MCSTSHTPEVLDDHDFHCICVRKERKGDWQFLAASILEGKNRKKNSIGKTQEEKKRYIMKFKCLAKKEGIDLYGGEKQTRFDNYLQAGERTVKTDLTIVFEPWWWRRDGGVIHWNRGRETEEHDCRTVKSVLVKPNAKRCWISQD